MNKATQILMLAGAMGFLPKQKYTTKKEHQSQEDKEKALAKAEVKRARKLKGKKCKSLK